MEIKPSDPHKFQLNGPAQQAEKKGTRFKGPGAQPLDRGADVPPVGVPLGVTQADLKDAAKVEDLLARCFGDLVDDAGRRLASGVSDTQKRDLVEFLGNDPVLRGKLLGYLKQVMK